MTFSYTSYDEDIFLKNIIKTYLQDGTEHCWLWKGGKNTNGYGYFANSSNTMFAHRFSVQYYGTTINDGLVVNHICEVRCCVNPKHLNIITQKENLRLRGIDQQPDSDIIIDLPKLKTKYEQCVERITECFCGLPKDAVKEMVEIKLKQTDYLDKNLDPEEKIKGVWKRKYFWILDEILKQYGYSYEDIFNKERDKEYYQKTKQKRNIKQSMRWNNGPT